MISLAGISDTAQKFVVFDIGIDSEATGMREGIPGTDIRTSRLINLGGRRSVTSQIPHSGTSPSAAEHILSHHPHGIALSTGKRRTVPPLGHHHEVGG
jgi:hypothetical protein